MRRSIICPIAGIAIAAMALASGCASESPGTGQSSTTNQSSSVSQPAQSGSTDGGTGPSSERPSQVNADATFTYADITSVSSLDSAKPNSSNAYRWLFPIYDRLIGLTPDAKLAPGIATKWESDASSTTITLTLDPNAKFQDGTPIDAKAVKANLERDASLADATSPVKTPAAEIASIATPDEHTIAITLNAPQSGFIYELTQGLGMMQSPASFDANPDTAPIGSGPYKVDKFDAGQSLTLTRVDDYWGDAPKDRPKTLRIISQPNAQTRMNALSAGEIDQTIIDPNQVDTVKKNSKLKLVEVNSIGIMNLYGNISKPSLSDQSVRKAVSLAINRQGLVDALTFGTAEPTGQLLGSGSNGYVSDLKPQYNLAQAKEMLAQAGYSDNKLKLSILILNRPLDKQIGESLQQMLKQAGIDVTLRVVDPARFDLYMKGETDMWVGRWNGRVDPEQTFEGVVGNGGFLNASGKAPQDLTDILTKVNATAPGADRDALLENASKAVVDQTLTWPLYESKLLYASTGCLVGFTHSVTSIDDLGRVQVSADCN